MRLVPYIRVSTEDQKRRNRIGTGHSVGQQLDKIRLWAQVAGHELAGVILDEGVSGSTPIAQRKGGAELIEQLRSGDVDGVVVIRLDRLFRNLRDALAFFEDEIGQRLCVVSLADSIDTSSPAGWFALVLNLAQADYARRLDVQRGKETNRALREAGKVYGNVPFGCVRREVDGQQKLFRDPARWPDREFIAHMRRAADCSYREIGAELRRRGIVSPAGGRAWSTSTIANICATHSDLARLPLLPNDAADCRAPDFVSHETGVSARAH